jgi:primary-amine oxidase
VAGSGAPAKPSHPLDPLCGFELTAAAEACRQLAQQQGITELRFNVITLKEPPKAALVAYEAGSGPCPPRQAFAILQVRALLSNRLARVGCS